MHPIHTLRSIAAQAGVEHHHVRYAVRLLGIKPTLKAGPTCIFSEIDARRLVAELRRIHGEGGKKPSEVVRV